jgi:hypothetical protein
MSWFRTNSIHDTDIRATVCILETLRFDFLEWNIKENGMESIRCIMEDGGGDEVCDELQYNNFRYI